MNTLVPIAFFGVGMVLGVGIIIACVRLRRPLAAAPKEIWSIAIYRSNNLGKIQSENKYRAPILTADDVTDASAYFVADPFLMQDENEKWHMFFEVFEADTRKGSIGYATSDNATIWTYKKIVIREPFHMSYPYVFKEGDKYYMIPESSDIEAIRLYEAQNFPYEWVFCKTLVEGRRYVDSVIFKKDNLWWIFSSDDADKSFKIFYSNDLTGNWSAHPLNAILNLSSVYSRNGGRVINVAGDFYRVAQKCGEVYGREVNLFQIKELNERKYSEMIMPLNPILKASGSGWNRDGMHHIDAHHLPGGWIAAVDGHKTVNRLERQIIWGGANLKNIVNR